MSQSVYLCTGNHDWSPETFDLRLEAITTEHSIVLNTSLNESEPVVWKPKDIEGSQAIQKHPL